MNYKEKYEVALETIQEILNSGEDTIEIKRLKLRLQSVFTELKENKEDRIKREILELVSIAGNGNQYEEIKDWLEKQSKNITYREYVFRPLPGDTIEKAAEKVVKLNGKIVLAFNGAYIPVLNKTKDEIVEEYHNWVKNQSKKSTIIDIDKMVFEYSTTEDGDLGFPINCMIRAYRKGIEDALYR